MEVCVQGRWSGVCGSNWNYQDAFVVCRQLGYPATGGSYLVMLCYVYPVCIGCLPSADVCSCIENSTL